MGSIPGVVLGAIFLIGLPELLREWAARVPLPVLRRRADPDDALPAGGPLPSRVISRELHVEEQQHRGGMPTRPSPSSIGARWTRRSTARRSIDERQDEWPGPKGGVMALLEAGR
jgi:hypothetical protein